MASNQQIKVKIANDIVESLEEELVIPRKKIVAEISLTTGFTLKTINEIINTLVDANKIQAADEDLIRNKPVKDEEVK